jgi:hypothetical protein
MTISDEMVERALTAYEGALLDLHSNQYENSEPISVSEIRSAALRAALTAALQGSPADKPCFHDEVVFLREVDAGTDSACWVISNRVDSGAVPFFRGVSVPRHEHSPPQPNNERLAVEVEHWLGVIGDRIGPDRRFSDTANDLLTVLRGQ